MKVSLFIFLTTLTGLQVLAQDELKQKKFNEVFNDQKNLVIKIGKKIPLKLSRLNKAEVPTSRSEGSLSYEELAEESQFTYQIEDTYFEKTLMLTRGRWNGYAADIGCSLKATSETKIKTQKSISQVFLNPTSLTYQRYDEKNRRLVFTDSHSKEWSMACDVSIYHRQQNTKHIKFYGPDEVTISMLQNLFSKYDLKVKNKTSRTKKSQSNQSRPQSKSRND